MKDTAQSLISFCRENGRICPLPIPWNTLYEMLPKKRRVGPSQVWVPPLPLVLSAWWTASDIEKQLRLIEHIEWAEKHDCLEEVVNYLRNLQEKDWHHL